LLGDSRHPRRVQSKASGDVLHPERNLGRLGSPAAADLGGRRVIAAQRPGQRGATRHSSRLWAVRSNTRSQSGITGAGAGNRTWRRDVVVVAMLLLLLLLLHPPAARGRSRLPAGETNSPTLTDCSTTMSHRGP